MSPEAKERIERLGQRRIELLAELDERASGLAWCERHCDIADEVVRVLFEDLQANSEDLPAIAIVATGGFGRRELSPYSDIDITVVPSDEASSRLDAAIRLLFQDLHWAFCTELRLDVGYAYRLISDAPGLDAKTRTGLMDMRLVAGSSDLFRNLDLALHHVFAAGEFLLSKIVEREEMYARHHDTPLVVEPQLKEGAGGLRDFQCANWLREAIGEHPTRPTRAYDTIVRYRNLLHLKAKKPQDFLSRQRQAEIADHLQKDVYEMMSEVALAGSELHEWYGQAREKLGEARFSLAPGVLSVRGEARVLPDADGGDAAVGIAVATRLALEVSDLPTVAGLQLNGHAALYAISTGEKTLRNLDRCRLLAQLLPELVACRALVPQDSVHYFTVFEHSLRVVRCLDQLESGSFLGDLRDSLQDLEPLYLAALLHDTGKIDPSQKHETVGAEIAERIVRRWELNDDTANTIVWLVREHLEMSRFIRIRDLQHPDTIEEFAAFVGTPERLAMLTLLTWADVSAVAPGSWTAAQDTFLRELYDRSLARLQDEGLSVPDPALTRQRLLRQLRGKPEDEGRIQRFLSSLPAYYLTSTPPDVVRLHLELSDRAEKGEATIEQFHRPDLSATEITVCAKDSPRLLNRFLGVLYAYDLSLLSIRACTTSSEVPIALDVFTVSFAGRPVPHATANQVSRALYDVVSGSKSVEVILTSRGKDPSRRQQFFKQTFIPGEPGILEVAAPRGRGMPYRLSRLLSDQGWNILAARVGQWAGNAAAAFYVVAKDGSSLTKEEVDLAMAAGSG